MSPEQLKANGIRVEVATITPLAGSLKLHGQLGLNADQEARVISPVSGAVREIRVQTGAQVEKGSVLAMIESQNGGSQRGLPQRQRTHCTGSAHL